MRYTHHRGLARVTSWVRLKYAAMNLKKLAEWSWNNSFFHLIASLFLLKSPLSPNENRDFFDKLTARSPNGDRAVYPFAVFCYYLCRLPRKKTAAQARSRMAAAAATAATTGSASASLSRTGAGDAVGVGAGVGVGAAVGAGDGEGEGEGVTCASSARRSSV